MVYKSLLVLLSAQHSKAATLQVVEKRKRMFAQYSEQDSQDHLIWIETCKMVGKNPPPPTHPLHPA